MSARKKRKKRVRLTRVVSERHHFGASDEARFRLAARLSSALGIALLLAGVCLPYLTRGSHAVSAHGSVALRVAGGALVIVSLMFSLIGKGK
jgi:hypothetical protein